MSASRGPGARVGRIRTLVISGIPAAVALAASVLSVVLAATTPETSLFTVIVPAVCALGATIAGYYTGIDRRSRFRRQQVFISYALEDRAAAMRLAQAVQEAGYRPWVDVDQVSPGADVRKALEGAVRDSGALLAILPRGTRHPFIDVELAAAAERARGLSASEPPILPVLIDQERRSSVPEWAGNTSWLELDSPLWRDELAHYLARVFDRAERSSFFGRPRAV